MKFRKRPSPANFAAVDAARASVQDEGVAEAAPVAEAKSEPTPAMPLEPPPVRADVVAGSPRPPARRPEPRPAEDAGFGLEPSSGRLVYLAAFALSVLWALAPVAFAVGYRNQVAPLQDDTFAMAVFLLLAIGPAAMIWGVAYMIRQAQKLAAEGRRAQAMTEDMLSPALVAAARAGHVTQSVREEIVRAGLAADEARETLLALRQALAQEADQLVQTTSTAVRTAEELGVALNRERTEMTLLAGVLDAQASRVTDAIGLQAKMVTEATELAETQLREAEAVLSARAADMTAAAGEAGDAARTAGEDLVRHIARLETAGVGVSEQIRSVESGLSDQRAALITLAHALKSDHETFATEAEAHAAKLSDYIGQARLSAMEMSDRAAKGGEALKQLMADAALQFRDLAETAHAEREEFGQSTLQSLDAVSQAAADQRAQLEAQTRAAIDALAHAAEETRAAAAAHAVTARDQVDLLSEAAFTAGQKANQVFEARLAEARALVEQSSAMVEQAGVATAQKLESGAAAARETLVELSAMMAEIEQHAQRLPASARNHADHVRSAVAHGMNELSAHARRTADEAQAIDTAFQERVRRNFEMLSEAVRLMGASAVAAPLPMPAPAAAAPPEPAPAPAKPAPRSRGRAPRADLDDALELKDVAEPTDEAEELGLRPRLKLTPTATDQEFSSIFEAAGGPPAAEAEPADGWTWRNLLASLDGDDGEIGQIQDALSEELGRMGVEPGKLLPKARIEEVAAAIQAGDLDGARQVVKRLAPAATRRISRRIATDDAMRRQVQIYVRRHQALVDDTVVRDPNGAMIGGLLASDAGRLYLLLDAAAGDMI